MVKPKDKTIRAGVVQFFSVAADIERNLDSVAEIIGSEEERIQLFVFPELALSGYLDDERALETAVATDGPEFERLSEITRNVSAVIGFIEKAEEGIYNSAACFEKGELVHIQRKISLVNYGRFRETHHFTAGVNMHTFSLNGFRAAVLICNDAWHPELAMLAALQEAELLIVPAAATFGGLAGYVENTHAWKQVTSHMAMVYGAYILFANYCGPRQGRTSFLGGSAILDPHGDVVARVSANLRGIQSAEIRQSLIKQMRKVLPISQNLQVDMTLRELRRIQDTLRIEEGELSIATAPLGKGKASKRNDSA